MKVFITNDSIIKKLLFALSHFVWGTTAFCIILLALLLLPSCQSTIRFSSTSKAGTPLSSSPTSSLSVKSRANSLSIRTNTVAPLSTILSTTQNSIIESAERWLGTPYRYGSMERDGTDCSGFVMRVYEEQGIQVPRSTKDQFMSGIRVEMPNLAVGDLLFFNTNGIGVSHVGIYVGNDSIIHASSKSGVIKQSFSGTYLAKTFLGARRILQEAAD